LAKPRAAAPVRKRGRSKSLAEDDDDEVDGADGSGADPSMQDELAKQKRCVRCCASDATTRPRRVCRPLQSL
jgi:hypothetical protein